MDWTQRDEFSGKMLRFTRSLRLKDNPVNRKLAEKLKKQKIKELLINPIIKANNYRLKDAVFDFLQLKHGSTYDNYQASLDRLIDCYGENTWVRLIKDLSKFEVFLRTLDNRNIKNKLNRRKLSQNTIYDYLRNARIFFNWLFKLKYIEKVPEIPKLQKQKTRIRPCPDWVILEVLDHLEGDRYLAIAILWLTGMRPNELCSLKWEDFEDDVVYIDNKKEHRPNEGFPYYPLFKEYVEPFRKHSGKVVHYKKTHGLHFWWKDTLSKLGLPYYPIYSIRKSFGTSLGLSAAPEKVTQELMRQKSPSVTKEYYIFADLKLRGEYAESVMRKKVTSKSTSKSRPQLLIP